MTAYRRLHQAMEAGLVASCHDLSEGGLGVAVCESAIGGRLGAAIDLTAVATGEGRLSDTALLFCETPSRFLATVPAPKAEEFESLLQDTPLAHIGVVTSRGDLRFSRSNQLLITVSLEEIVSAWKSPL
jgi:phosphoribosylformylglycinamidine synthase